MMLRLGWEEKGIVLVDHRFRVIFRYENKKKLFLTEESWFTLICSKGRGMLSSLYLSIFHLVSYLQPSAT